MADNPKYVTSHRVSIHRHGRCRRMSIWGVIMNMPAAIDQEHYNGRQQTTTWARVNALCVTQQHQMRVEVSPDNEHWFELIPAGNVTAARTRDNIWRAALRARTRAEARGHIWSDGFHTSQITPGEYED